MENIYEQERGRTMLSDLLYSNVPQNNRCSQQQRQLWHICRIVTLRAFVISHTRTYKRSFLSCLPFTYPPNYSDNMGMSYRRYLSGERIYGCSTCKTHLATIHSMMSRVNSLSSSSPSIVSHLVMDRPSTANMVVHIFSMACKSLTASRSDHSAYILFPQGKCRRRRAWRPPNDDRQPHCPRYLLLQMRHNPWLEIRKCPFRFTPRLILTDHVGQGVRTVSEVQGRQIYPWA